MSPIERTKILAAYKRAIELGAGSHEEAVASAAQSLGIVPELVEAAVWEQER